MVLLFLLCRVVLRLRRLDFRPASAGECAVSAASACGILVWSCAFGCVVAFVGEFVEGPHDGLPVILWWAHLKAPFILFEQVGVIYPCSRGGCVTRLAEDGIGIILRMQGLPLAEALLPLFKTEYSW